MHRLGANARNSCLLEHVLVATLVLSGMPTAVAGTLYKCTGDDGNSAYVSQRIKGQHCSVAANYVSDRPVRPVAHSPAPESGAAMGSAPPVSSDPSRASDDALNSASPDTTAIHIAALVSPPSGAPKAVSSHLTDFGDPNSSSVFAKLGDSGAGFRYVQIGDSHTAGDYLTDALRLRLQARLGNGGDGWAMPMRVPGQRLARVNYDYDGWALINSRSGEPADYPFGGFIAQVVRDHAVLTMKSKQGEPAQTITAIIRQGQGDQPLVISDSDGRRQVVASPDTDGQWHSVTFTARLPMVVVAEHCPLTAIGGWWLSTEQANGAIVSAVGINGSELSQWSRWRNDWRKDLEPGQPDVIAIAYGTNEALDRSINENLVRTDLETEIDRFRQRFPHAAVLILGAPESLSSKGGRCGLRAPSLDAVQRIQREVAANRKTLFWDWQQAMGGTCSMKTWISEGLGRGDGVHFSAAGYTQLGYDIYQGLVGLASNPAGDGHQDRNGQMHAGATQQAGHKPKSR